MTVIYELVKSTDNTELLYLKSLCPGAPNSAKFRGGVAEGHLRFDKGGGGGCNNFLLFTR